MGVIFYFYFFSIKSPIGTTYPFSHLFFFPFAFRSLYSVSLSYDGSSKRGSVFKIVNSVSGYCLTFGEGMQGTKSQKSLSDVLRYELVTVYKQLLL